MSEHFLENYVLLQLHFTFSSFHAQKKQDFKGYTQNLRAFFVVYYTQLQSVCPFMALSEVGFIMGEYG
jgi:hypothetical protein